jgi:hypothetical protein
MSMETILHALGLHLYQPAGNLRKLLDDNAGELRRILLCYERLARHAHKYSAVARLHVALSSVLVEQLRDPELIEACRDLADIPSILEGLRSAAAIEFVGTGFRHAPLPLIPREDWDEQLQIEREVMEATFGRVLKGYWPPTGLFTAEMVPALVKAGYEYLLLPAPMLAMPDGGGADPYRAYRLCHQKSCISVVPLDQGFSQAQGFGLEAPWFADAVRDGVAQAPPSSVPYLLGTWSDGENGEWFRREDEQEGFFGKFFSPYMEFCETGEFPARTVFLSEYLRRFPPRDEVRLRAAPGLDAGAPDDAGRAAFERLFKASARYWSLARPEPGQPMPPSHALRQARELLLRAEESGLLLGDASLRGESLALLTRAERLMTVKPPQAATGARAPAVPEATAPDSKPKAAVKPAETRQAHPTSEASGAPKRPNRPRPASRKTARPRPGKPSRLTKK